MMLAYLATPYSKYKAGIEQAFIDAAKLAARLMQAGINVYSPIAHTHPIAIYGEIDPYDLTLWLELDRAMMSKCDTLIVAHMDGWEQSSGVAHEIAFFAHAGRPVFDLDCDTLHMELRRAELAAE